MPLDPDTLTDADTLPFLDILQDAGEWVPADLDVILTHLMTQTKVNISTQNTFTQAMEGWAKTDQAVRLFDALEAAARRQGKVHVIHDAAKLGRAAALGQGHEVTFTHLCQPPYRWSAEDQAQLIQDLIQKDFLLGAPPSASPRMEAFWAVVPLAQRPDLYQALANQLSLDLIEGVGQLLAFHAWVPQPQQSHLDTGVAEFFSYRCLMRAVGSNPEDFYAAWSQARSRVTITAVLADFTAKIGNDQMLHPDPRHSFMAILDLMLADAPVPLQTPWLDRKDLDLPRTHAARRQHRLAQRPSKKQSRPRPRS